MSEQELSPDSVIEAAETAAQAPSVLQNRAFLFLWLSQILSQVGQNALMLGLLVLVQRLTQSPTHLSLATFSLILPAVLFSMLAGVIIDHLNKKTVMVTTNALRAVLSLTYLFLGHTIFLVYVVSFLFATVGQFFAPAEASAIPMLVKRRQLITANALFNLTLSASQLVGLVILAPLLIKLGGTTGFFIVLAILFALAAISVSLVPRDKELPKPLTTADSAAMVRTVWAELVEGVHILRGDRLASVAMFFVTLIASVIPVLAVLGPVFAVSVIRASAEDIVYLFAPAGVGMLLATLFLDRTVQRIPKLRLMPLGLIVLGVSLTLIAAAKTGGSYVLYNVIGRVMDTRNVAFELVPLIMVISFVLGISYIWVSVPAQTLLQERCPASFRGRIFGVQFTLSGAVSIIPLLFAGTFADLFGVNKTVFLMGAIVIAIGVVAFRSLATLSVETEGSPP